MRVDRVAPVTWYLAATTIFLLGLFLAARHYPGGYDWFYTVVSALASRKENPNGSYWFSAAILFSMLLLWPYISGLKKRYLPSLPGARYSIGALKVGVIGGCLVGAERLVVYDLSSWLNKSHEFIALITFLAFYFGALGLLFQRMLRQRLYLLPLLAVATPLLALGVVDFLLYLQQRNIGWVGVAWREKDIPLWASFAFWQWLLVVFLWIGLGTLSYRMDEGQESS